MKRTAWLLGLFLLVAPTLAQQPAAAKRAMTIDDLFKFKRVSDPRISPDGQWVVYTVGVIDDVATNKSSSTLWIASPDGKTRKQLTTTPKKDSQPRWSPDGKSVLFVSNRADGAQLWITSMDGGEPKQLTKISTGVSEPTWSRDGKMIAFVSARVAGVFGQAL